MSFIGHPTVGPINAVGKPTGATNLVSNGGFETDTTGWMTFGTNTIEASAEQAQSGAQSLKAIYADDVRLADFGITLTAAQYTASAFVYIPTAYDGTNLQFGRNAFVGASGDSLVSLDMGIRDAWQRVSVTWTPDSGDLLGNIRVVESGASPTAGRFVYIDSVQIALGPTATPYIETDGGAASRAPMKWVA